jgi:putative phosphoribosyl transferase
MATRFKDRTDAGLQLATLLTHLRGQKVLVLGLPRGGVTVASEVARSLRAPLDVLNVRKLGVPWQEELAMGAIAAGGVRVLNNDVIMATGITKAILEEATALKQVDLDWRERVYRHGRPAPDVRGRTVILVDDGIATGATVRAAIAILRVQHPTHLVLAAPVVQDTIASELEREVDELVCVMRPGDLYAVGVWYDHFPQLTDHDVQAILAHATAEPAASSTDVSRLPNDPDRETEELHFPTG